ncbi:MAG: hypothetical protein V4805_01775 [Pseudomonadota bacterium]
MHIPAKLCRYFGALATGKIVLWCYLIWYLSTAAHHFDPSPAIWLNSLGISAFIGVALVLSIGGKISAGTDKWQIFRLFLMPFCVSSFSALIKGRGFILIIPAAPGELAVSIGLCACFIALVLRLRRAGTGVTAG